MSQSQVSDKGYQEALWCIKKHLLLTKTHIEETIQKLIRECTDDKCKISLGTQIEGEDAIRNLAAAEEHVMSVMAQTEFNLSPLLDDFRSLRQSLANTKVPFRIDLDVKKTAPGIWNKNRSTIENLLTRTDEYASEMKQEDIDCPVCIEDLNQHVKERDDLKEVSAIDKQLSGLEHQREHHLKNRGDSESASLTQATINELLVKKNELFSRNRWNTGPRKQPQQRSTFTRTW